MPRHQVSASRFCAEPDGFAVSISEAWRLPAEQIANSLRMPPTATRRVNAARVEGSCDLPSYLSKLEKGASYPGREIIPKLTAVLEIEPAELLRLSEHK